MRSAATRPALPPPFRIVGRIGSILAAAVGIVCMIGWIFDLPDLARLQPDQPATRMNSAVAVTLLALATLSRTTLRRVLATLGGAVGVVTLGEYAVRTHGGIDQLLATDTSGTAYPGRMSMLSAVLISLLAASILLVDRRPARAGTFCTIVTVATCSLVLLGWAYDLPTLQHGRPLSTVALPTAAALWLISVAVALGAPSRTLVWAATADEPGALLIRRLLPVAGIGLPLFGFVALLGEWADWYGSDTTAAVIVVSSAVVVGWCTWSAGRRVSRAARTRQRAVDELTELRDDLERQVAERAEQLQRRGNEIAVLEDRQRIAADLHDIVIQRLFAAGMFLHSGPTSDPQVRERVDAAVGAMDAAIHDLRTSIFELNARGRRPGLDKALAAVCADSAPMLGFAPTLDIDDPDGHADAVREDLLAVAREGLANVARHARAGAVQVVVQVRDTQVIFTITDNGVGMTGSTRVSGTGNVRARALVRGGDCEWLAVEPSGTRLCWQVPVVVPGAGPLLLEPELDPELESGLDPESEPDPEPTEPISS